MNLEIDMTKVLKDEMATIALDEDDYSLLQTESKENLEWLKSPLAIELEKDLRLFGLDDNTFNQIKDGLIASSEEVIDSVDLLTSRYPKSGGYYYCLDDIYRMLDVIVCNLEDAVPDFGYLEVREDLLVEHLKELIHIHYGILVP